MQLILASTSRWRQQMLRNAGLAVTCEAPGVDEDCDLRDPAARAVTLAMRKAHAVASRRREAWVLGADQVVTDGVEIWGKPIDPEDHLSQLRNMRGRAHRLVTGFALVGPGFEETGHEVTTLWVRPDLTDAELRAYVATGEGSGCAGGYAIEGHGAFLFERIEGDWFNILGLPLLQVMKRLRARGWRYGGGQ